MTVDFRCKLADQLEFIERSCLAFDDGHPAEAVRIAIAVRIMLHQTPHSTCLLEHLGVRDKIQLLSSTVFRFIPREKPEGLVHDWTLGPGMLALSSSGTKHVAVLNDPQFHHQLPVEDWWQEVVHVLDADTRITRRHLVLSAADKDGGAHVDDLPDPAYTRMATPFDGPAFVTNGDESTRRMHYQALRVVGAEILASSDLRALIDQA